MSKNRKIIAVGTTRSLLPGPSLRGLTQEKPSPGSQIQVEINGRRNEKGMVLCAIFSFPEGFPTRSEKAIAHAQSEIAERHATCQFSSIAPGTYAVSVFHDENSNGKLDTNFIGIPREGVGASKITITYL